MPDGATLRAPKRKRGGQSKYTDEIAEEICDRLARGQHLLEICAAEHMPAEATVRLWASDSAHPFAAMYARARESGYERLAEEVLAIGDADYRLPDGTVDNAAVQQARLRSDNRKWLLSKMMPKRYGDRVTAEITGDPNAPVISRIEIVAIPAVHRQLGPVIDAGCDDGSEPSTLPKPAETLD